VPIVTDKEDSAGLTAWCTADPKVPTKAPRWIASLLGEGGSAETFGTHFFIMGFTGTNPGVLPY
jgi:hypothetical protein